MERPGLSEALDQARAAMDGLAQAFKRGFGAGRRDPYLRGRRRPTSYPGPRPRDDNFDRARMEAAKAKRDRKQDANLRRGQS